MRRHIISFSYGSVLRAISSWREMFDFGWSNACVALKSQWHSDQGVLWTQRWRFFLRFFFTIKTGHLQRPYLKRATANTSPFCGQRTFSSTTKPIHHIFLFIIISYNVYTYMMFIFLPKGSKGDSTRASTVFPFSRNIFMCDQIRCWKSSFPKRTNSSGRQL